MTKGTVSQETSKLPPQSPFIEMFALFFLFFILMISSLYVSPTFYGKARPIVIKIKLTENLINLPNFKPIVVFVKKINVATLAAMRKLARGCVSPFFIALIPYWRGRNEEASQQVPLKQNIHKINGFLSPSMNKTRGGEYKIQLEQKTALKDMLLILTGETKYATNFSYTGAICIPDVGRNEWHTKYLPQRIEKRKQNQSTISKRQNKKRKGVVEAL